MTAKTKNKRSKLEVKFQGILDSYKVKNSYETEKLPYVVPASNHTYLVDFTLGNGIRCEVKGYLSDYAERQKYILIKQQHPDIDLRFVFADNNKKCGGMKMTHAEWAIKNGFKFCSINDLETLQEWFKEKK